MGSLWGRYGAAMGRTGRHWRWPLPSCSRTLPPSRPAALGASALQTALRQGCVGRGVGRGWVGRGCVGWGCVGRGGGRRGGGTFGTGCGVGMCGAEGGDVWGRGGRCVGQRGCVGQRVDVWGREWMCGAGKMCGTEEGYVGQYVGQGIRVRCVGQMHGAIYGAGGRQCVGLTSGQGGAEPQQRHQVCHIAVQTASNAGVLRGGEKVGGDGGRYGAGGGNRGRCGAIGGRLWRYGAVEGS